MIATDQELIKDGCANPTPRWSDGVAQSRGVLLLEDLKGTHSTIVLVSVGLSWFLLDY